MVTAAIRVAIHVSIKIAKVFKTLGKTFDCEGESFINLFAKFFLERKVHEYQVIHI